jgi:hypothetical protein
MEVNRVQGQGGAVEIAKFLASGKGAVLVWGSLLVALMIVVARWSTIRQGRKLNDRLGAVNWSFTDSWATTLTALGALLGTILSTTGILPESTKLLSNAALGGLNLVFGLMVLVAPLVFSAFSHDTANNYDEPSYQGTVWSFLIACIITIWAVVGELATIMVLLQELAVGTLSVSLSWLFVVLLLIAEVLLVVYAWSTMRGTIVHRETQEPGAAAGADDTRPRGWSLL